MGKQIHLRALQTSGGGVVSFWKVLSASQACCSCASLFRGPCLGRLLWAACGFCMTFARQHGGASMVTLFPSGPEVRDPHVISQPLPPTRVMSPLPPQVARLP